MRNCKVCRTPTEVVFNIDFKAVPICEGCATRIFMQQAKWYTEQTEKSSQITGWLFQGTNEEGLAITLYMSGPTREAAIVNFETSYPQYKWHATTEYFN